MRTGRISLLLLLVTLAGCGGKSDDASSATPSGSGGNGNSGGGGAHADAMASKPKCSETGYAGDELCLAPPEQGLQLHYGPATYSTDDTAPFLLEPSADVTDCFYLEMPNDSEIAITRSEVRMRTGGARPGVPTLLVFASDGRHAPGLGPCDPLGSMLLLGSYNGSTLDAPDRIAPENVGLALPLHPHQPIVMRVHYENATDQPLLREVWINLITTDPQALTARMHNIGLIGGVGMMVPPGTTQTLTPSASAPQDMRLLGLVGYFHAHTKRLTAWKETGGIRTLLLEQYDMMVSRPLYFDSVHENPPPDRATRSPGGLNGPVELAAGDKIAWECEVDNDLNSNIAFGEAALTAEMCNLFGFYAPSDGTAWFTTIM